MNERLLRLRTAELNLSQEEFGSKIGVTRAAVSRYPNLYYYLFAEYFA